MTTTDPSQVLFYVSRSDQWDGPFSIHDIGRQITEKRIKARDRMYVAGTQETFTAGQLTVFPKLTSSYHDWLWCIKNNPKGVDPRGAALLFAALPITFFATLFGLEFFPPGTYPKLVLAAPGLVVGTVFSYIYGFIIFKMPKILGVILSIVIGSAGLYLMWQVLKSL